MRLLISEAFLTANFMVIYFGCGLVFFLMGFGAAIATRTFRESPLALARDLPFLAGFGLMEGVAQWGVLFIPMQASYLPTSALAALLVVQTGVMVLAQASLFAFGLRLTARKVGERWLRPWSGLVLAVLTLWLIWFALHFPGWELSPELVDWRMSGMRWAVYLMGMPGAILSGWGVLRQRQEMVRYYATAAWFLTGTALAFLLLVVLNPWVLPTVPVYELQTPAIHHFNRLFGIPVQIFLAVDGLILAYFTMQALEVFRRENRRRLEESELRRGVLEERSRIGHQLNDDVMQDILGVGMMLDSIQERSTSRSDSQDSTLPLAVDLLGQIVERLRGYVSALEPSPWESLDLAQGLKQLIDQFQAETLTPVRLHLEPSIAIDPVRVIYLYRIIYEALAHVRRRAGASSVEIRLVRSDCLLELTIRHSGRAELTAMEQEPEYGRMREAAAAAGGSVLVASNAGRGTEVRFELLLENN